MAPLVLFLALILQSSFTFGNIENNEEDFGTREGLKPAFDDEDIKTSGDNQMDWMKMFLSPTGPLHSTSAAALMAKITNSDTSPEEQVENIKELTEQINSALVTEMVSLLTYAMSNSEKPTEESSQRKRRSAESPMDSSQLVMRLLKHIKSNNEYQNIAIEKMMSAQEIADKYGIKFDPDTEILSDLANAAKDQAKELSSIYKDACDAKNATEQVEFVPLEERREQCPADNKTYYVYSVHPQQHVSEQNAFLPYEYCPEPIHSIPPNNHLHKQRHDKPYETQVLPPPHQCAPVTPKPNFYDTVMSFTPVPEFNPYCLFEPVTTTTTIVLPFDEPVVPEPELVGEEYEETVSSKVTMDCGDEPGSSTINHVMTYTLSEKAHFRTPEIEQLPQQMQYTFFLM